MKLFSNLQYSSLLLCLTVILTQQIAGQISNNQMSIISEDSHDFNKTSQFYDQVKKQRAFQFSKDIVQQNNSNISMINDLSAVTKDHHEKFKKSKLYNKRINIASTSNQALKRNNPRILASGLPTSFDWSKNLTMTPIKSIGSCASSWAFSVTAFLQADSQINLNSSSALDLSEQYLISCDFQSHQCEGGSVQTAIDLVINKGSIPLQTKYPYQPINSQPSDICKPSSDSFKISQNLRMSYYNIMDQEIIKKIVLKKPVIVGVNAQDFQNYVPGISEQDKILRCNPAHRQLNHEVLLVGYTNSYWIVKNHWGTSWGINGYGYISRNSLQDCFIGQQMHTSGAKSTNCTIKDCVTCVQDYTCFKCQDGKYVYHNIDTGVQTCEVCSASNCRKCYDYSGWCDYCIDGYAINSTNGKCQKSAIQNCNHIAQGYCTQCHSGYLLSSDSTACTADCLTRFCKKCQLGPCTQCNLGYSLTTATNGTIKCTKNNCAVQNCLSCDTSGACVKCISTLILNGSKCINTCPIVKCLSCPSSAWLCQQCVDGMSFNYWIQLCETFTVANCGIHLFGKCYECKKGYQFDGGRASCIQNCAVDNCTSCQLYDTTICIKCQSGYNLTVVDDVTTCIAFKCAIQNCTACDQNGTACLACITKFHIYNATINKCIINCTRNNCQICLPTDSSCQRCKAGYIVQYDSGSCVKITIDNCILVGYWQNSLECWTCQAKYIVDIVSWTKCLLNCTDQNCKVCDYATLTICSQCYDGYQLSLDSQRLGCVLVPSFLPNCLKTSPNQTYCYQCSDFYYYNSSYMSCLPYTTNCPDLCQSCPPPNSTTEGCKCKKGFAYDVYTMECGISPYDQSCLQIGQYGTTLICYQCSSDYVLKPDFKGCEQRCKAANCTACYPDSNVYCLICNDGFYSNSTWKCAQCPVKNCRFCNNLTCHSCKTGYQLSPAQDSCTEFNCTSKQLVFDGLACSCPLQQFLNQMQCSSCQDPNCRWCDTDGCVECFSGFFKSNSQCKPCISNCRKCTNATNCHFCNDFFFFGDSQLQCLEINLNRTYRVNGTLVNMCPVGCLNCNSTGVCNLCKYGYALSPSNQCIPCDGQCSRCYYNLPSVCLSCNAGYFLFPNATCTPCTHLACIQCKTDQKACTKCINGYFAQNRTCALCPNNCLVCNQFGQCTKCSTGFTITANKTCSRCIGDCRNCNSTLLDQCLVYCQKGQYLENNQCKSCPSHCKVCNSSTVCLQCYSNYILKTNLCVNVCQQGCYQCTQIDNKVCTICFAGYNLSTTGTCIPDVTCNATGTCKACPKTYAYANTSKCMSCQIKAPCIQCASQNKSQCIECSFGYYLSKQTCLSCPAQCANCIRQNACTSCLDGFYFVPKFNQNLGLCFNCSAQCKTCQNSASQCTSCNQNETLTISNRCLGKNRISIQVKLDIKLQQYFKIATQFILDMTALLGSKYVGRTQYVIIKGVRSGSTIVDVELVIPQGEDPQQILTNVKSALSTTTSLGGVALLSVQNIQISDQSNNPSVNPQIPVNPIVMPVISNQVNSTTLTIVLAVIIPSALIILVVAGFIIRKMFFLRQNIVTNIITDGKPEESFQQIQPKMISRAQLPPLQRISAKKIEQSNLSSNVKPQQFQFSVINQQIVDQSLGQMIYNQNSSSVAQKTIEVNSSSNNDGNNKMSSQHVDSIFQTFQIEEKVKQFENYPIRSSGGQNFLQQDSSRKFNQQINSPQSMKQQGNFYQLKQFQVQEKIIQGNIAKNQQALQVQYTQQKNIEPQIQIQIDNKLSQIQGKKQSQNEEFELKQTQEVKQQQNRSQEIKASLEQQKSQIQVRAETIQQNQKARNILQDQDLLLIDDI